MLFSGTAEVCVKNGKFSSTEDYNLIGQRPDHEISSIIDFYLDIETVLKDAINDEENVKDGIHHFYFTGSVTFNGIPEFPFEIDVECLVNEVYFEYSMDLDEWVGELQSDD